MQTYKSFKNKLYITLALDIIKVNNILSLSVHKSSLVYTKNSNAKALYNNKLNMSFENNKLYFNKS